MRIRRLLLRSFGCLRGEYHFSADRLNLLLEPNERGKSTLAAAILAALYGFPPGQRRSENRPFTDLELHRPWAGEEYLVEMDVEVEGRVFTIRRDFAKKEERVYEWRTGKEITAEFQVSKESLDFAGKLTGLNREEFSRTVFLRQSEMREVRSPGGITAALQRTATSQTGDVAAAEAIGVLDGALRQYRGRKIRRGKIENEISGIEDELRDLTAQIDEMEARRRRAEERIRELEETSHEENRNDEALKRLEYMILASGRREDAARLEEETREAAELSGLEEEFQSLESFSAFPADGLARILEIRARMETLGEEEERTRNQASEETETPLRELEGEAEDLAEFAVLDAEARPEISELETDLVAAFKARREAKRTLRRALKEMRKADQDPDRLRELASRFSNLSREDREFLLDYGVREIEARSALKEADRDVERLSEDLEETEEDLARTGSASRGLLIGAAAALLATVVLAFSGLHVAFPILAGLVAAGLGAAWLALRPRASAQAKATSLQEEMEAIERAGQERSEAVESIRERLLEICRRVDLESPEVLLDEFRQAEAGADAIARLGAHGERQVEATGSLERASGAIRERMNLAGHRPRFDAVTPGTARRFRELWQWHQELTREIGQLREKQAAAGKRIEELIAERTALQAEVEELLDRAGLEPAGDMDQAVSRFEEGQRKRERYETLKREVIPSLVRRALSHRGEELRRSVELADQILRKKDLDNAELAELEPEKSHKEYVEERDRLRQDAKSLAERRLELSSELGEVLREYRRDYPDARRWQSEWTEQLERARAFQTAVSRASEVLETLSREAYAEWADVLNERASEALDRIAPDYDDLRFDEDLSFTLRDRRDGSRRSREDVDCRFSAGTRDQIYLAARLAVAEYLSSGKVKLPLILDDPFAFFDDERFSGALSMLLSRLSRRHQIILFSCHEARHRTWQDQNARLSAERIRVMTLQTFAT